MRVIILLMLAALLWGCSNANDSAVTVNVSGKHPSDWIAAHSSWFLNSTSNCKDCHGATLTGGISGVSCSSSSFNGQACHANGPHPVPWPAHNQSTNQFNNCTPCHGVALAGGTSAPACSQCHTDLPLGTVPILGTCISCHGAPPLGPSGSVYPNISAAHRPHTQLALSCSVCHAGGGTGTSTHGTSLTLAFPPAYNAKTGTAVINPDGTCSAVSCHGGQTTPAWRSGRKIDPNQECSFCHGVGTAAGVPQSNSYYSGKHEYHLVTLRLLCTDCHDMAVVSGGAAHFSGLSTPVFELAPSATMKAPLNFSSGVRSCSPGTLPPANTFSIGVCHSTKNW